VVEKSHIGKGIREATARAARFTTADFQPKERIFSDLAPAESGCPGGPERYGGVLCVQVVYKKCSQYA